MPRSLDRRQFFQQAAATSAAAGVVLAASPRTAVAAANDTVVLGVMGCQRGSALARGFAGQDGVEVKYVCDVDINRAASCADNLKEQFGQRTEAIKDFRRILDDQSVDAFVCAAPNHWHAPATILACLADKHVYVEKPCSHNPYEGEWMVDVAHTRGRAVQMGSQRRSGPGTQKAIQELHDGVIGRVYLSRAWYTNARGSIGIGKRTDPPAHLDYDLWQGPAPRRPYYDNRIHYNWHWFWHWGNGELGNNGVHTLDLCRWGVGVEFPKRVTSSGGRYRYDDDQETPDTHTVCYEFDGECQITWEGLSCNRRRAGFVAFYGEEGTLELDASGTYRVFDAGDKLVKEVESPSDGSREHWANFLEAIRTGKPETLNAEIAEGHKSTLLCHLGNIAHRTGRSLDCDPTNGHILNDDEAMQFWRREYEPGWLPSA